MSTRTAVAFVIAAATLLSGWLISRPQQKTAWSEQEKPILQQLRTLRSLPDDVRANTTRALARQILALPARATKVELATDLANLATEGDFGLDTLQEVTNTLADSLREHPMPTENGGPAAPYFELAQLVRYEHMQASSDSPQFSKAMAKFEADDQRRQNANFTLADLEGNKWTLKELRGKVVLVNFWATWCPPCRKEMPDLEALSNEFKDQGLVVLGISDEDGNKVKSFVAEHNYTYPILLDPGRKVNELYQVNGIPKTFVYDGQGQLVAQSIDKRTRDQFLGMLAEAGLK